VNFSGKRNVRCASRYRAFARAIALLSVACAAESASNERVTIVGEAVLFAPNVASTEYAEIRLTLSPDGRTALWFSRNRPGGPGGYDIWISRQREDRWAAATPVTFNSPTRDFDPAFSADGAYIYFCSDRAGGLGGDDVYRVALTADDFGAAENLGPTVNSSGNEFAPMLSPDGTQLLFSSDRNEGTHDLFIAHRNGAGFAAAQPVAGAINTSANEFDATFLADGRTIVFARAKDFRTDRVDLFVATRHDDGYDAGERLPLGINSTTTDTYGPMLDWSSPDRVTFSGQRNEARGMDLYLVRYLLRK
jgi:Tol biopolymer transport system component